MVNKQTSYGVGQANACQIFHGCRWLNIPVIDDYSRSARFAYTKTDYQFRSRQVVQPKCDVGALNCGRNPCRARRLTGDYWPSVRPAAVAPCDRVDGLWGVAAHWSKRPSSRRRRRRVIEQ